MRQFMRIATCVALMFAALTSSGQDDVASKKKEINSIKKDPSYIYGESTMADRQDAIDLAKDVLYQNINQWVESQKKVAGTSNVPKVNASYNVTDIVLPRGNWHRAFMYVKKSDIVSVGSDAQVAEVANPKRSEDADAPEVPATEDLGLSQELIQDFLKPANTGQLSAMLKTWKAKGTILEYNKLSALNSPEQYVLFIFSKEGNVCAVLSAGAERRNLRTGEPDNVGNYKGNGAIGIKVNTNR